MRFSPKIMILNTQLLSTRFSVIFYIHIVQYKNLRHANNIYQVVTWLNWLKHHSMYEEVAILIPALGTCSGFWAPSPVGSMHQAKDASFLLMFLSLYLSLLLTLFKINKNI